MPVPVKMIVVDIDGTLLPSPGTGVTRRNSRALRDAEAAGIEIVIATGRRQAYTLPLLEPVGLKPETVLITSNGTVTRTMAGRSHRPLSVAGGDGASLVSGAAPIRHNRVYL